MKEKERNLILVLLFEQQIKRNYLKITQLEVVD